LKKVFLEWMEQQLGKSMGPNELLKEYEKKFGQLLLSERQLLEARKLKLFLQATDEALEDRLLLLLQDRTRSFNSNWKKLEESVNFIAKQQHVKVLRFNLRTDVAPLPSSKASAALVPSTPLSSLKGTIVKEDILEGGFSLLDTTDFRQHLC